MGHQALKYFQNPKLFITRQYVPKLRSHRDMACTTTPDTSLFFGRTHTWGHKCVDCWFTARNGSIIVVSTRCEGIIKVGCRLLTILRIYPTAIHRVVYVGSRPFVIVIKLGIRLVAPISMYTLDGDISTIGKDNR